MNRTIPSTILTTAAAVAFTLGAYPPNKATIGLTVASASPGSSIDAKLTGFSPGESVVITLCDGTSVTVSADLSGTANATLPVPSTPGNCALTAAGAAGGSAATSLIVLPEQATAPSTSVPPTTVAGGGTSSGNGQGPNAGQVPASQQNQSRGGSRILSTRGALFAGSGLAASAAASIMLRRFRKAG